MIIKHTKKTTLYSNNMPWRKIRSDFDVTMGSFDGAQTCELVGLFLILLFQLRPTHLDVNVGLYRDDGLATCTKTPKQVTYLGPSASQSSDGDASAASRILVVSFLQVCLFWATDLKCSRSFRLVSCSLSSDTRVRSLLRTTGSVVKGRPLNLFPCDIK